IRRGSGNGHGRPRPASPAAPRPQPRPRAAARRGGRSWPDHRGRRRRGARRVQRPASTVVDHVAVDRPAGEHRSAAAVTRMWAAGVVIVLALAAAVVGVVLTLELNPWSFAVLPVAIVLGVVAL